MIRQIDRVVVTFDSASEDAAAIDTAVRLAARAKAPLHGVFVEDEELLAMTSSPVTRHVTFGAGTQRYTSEALELQLQIEAERARRELFEAAKRHGVKCTFEVLRGAPMIIAAACASERDLLVAAALGRPVAGHFRLECRWWSSINAVPGPFLLAHGAPRRGGTVVLWLRDSGAAAARLVDIAAEMAEAEGSSLVVACPPGLAGSKDFEMWLTDRLQGHAVPLDVEVAAAEPAAFKRRIGELECHLLAIDASLLQADGRQLRDLVQGLRCDVLIVR
jgi:nucleotide-binding universal stress UspA family protein